MLENERTEIVNNKLFNSLSAPIPPVRRDIQIIPVTDNGRDLLIFYDPIKIAESGFALDSSVEPILSLIDGQKSITQMQPFFRNGISPDKLLEFVQMLDNQKLLESPYFQHYSGWIEEQFENSDIRQPALVQTSYPAEIAELKAFMDSLMDEAGSSNTDNPVKEAKALYAPHIDLRVGSKQYAEAFSALKNLRPKRVVILATSHYSGYHPEIYDGNPFIGSRKDYLLPGTRFETDLAYIEKLEETAESAGFTLHDRAHRIEHSIETHLLFIHHIWQHDFKIVPILVGGLDELFYKEDGDLGQKVSAFTETLQQADDEDTFYLISGDLSHVGRKFGDQVQASIMRPDVEEFDESFLSAAVQGDNQIMLQTVAEEFDAYRVCGFPPLYTFLKAFPGLNGKKINYHWWDESERESAVSFGSVIY